MNAIRTEPEGLTVDGHWILHLYTWLHARDYTVLRVTFPGSDGEQAVAHLSLPAGKGPHPGVVAFPILAGSHVVSEALSKALVRRGYAVLRMERRPLDLACAKDPEEPMAAFRAAILDGRALLDWLAARPDIDPERLAVAGVSLGGILAFDLMGVDERIRAGFFVMTGGGLAEILHDSTEKPVAKFRRRLAEKHALETREDVLAYLRPFVGPYDPLRYADGIERDRVLLISGQFDRVMPPERTRVMWDALGRPEWKRFPAGHYQLFPFFWWAMAHGADHLDRVFSMPR